MDFYEPLEMVHVVADGNVSLTTLVDSYDSVDLSVYCWVCAKPTCWVSSTYLVGCHLPCGPLAWALFRQAHLMGDKARADYAVACLNDRDGWRASASPSTPWPSWAHRLTPSRRRTRSDNSGPLPLPGGRVGAV